MKNIIITFALIITLYYFYGFIKRENFVSQEISDLNYQRNTNKVTFLTAEQTKNYILEDGDTYIHDLSQWDLFARKIDSTDDYKIASAHTSMNFTNEQKDRFSKATIAADAFFNTIHTTHTTNIDSIDGNKIANIPWIFAMTDGTVYEDGLPHTRGNIIFVSNNITETPDYLIKTFIHEKIHIYERMYPADIDQFLIKNRYTRVKRRYGIPRIRANPDLDEWVYVDEKNGKELMALYSSDKPHNITDVILNDTALEHPYELLAYKIADLYK
uniref:Uncharacterized protein n=1 Tax=viral metagenome TaxID=1070528 RepID=A0A6C0KT27_9ZZZZ